MIRPDRNLSRGDARPPTSWRKKLAFSIVTTLVFFVGLETLLWMVGVQPVTDAVDPLAGFSGQVPLLESSVNDNGNVVISTAPSKLVWFNPQSFIQPKGTDTKRIFCVGGSTTFGRPYDDTTSYSGWLREFLPAIDSSTNWEVFNAGGVSYASYRVAAVMDELASYQPDLFIVYSGHNEFLERRTYEGMFDQPAWRRELSATLQRTRTGSLLERIAGAAQEPFRVVSPMASEVDEILNHSIGPEDYQRDDKWHDDVYAHYEFNLRRMIRVARNAGAEILLVTPASNRRDCSPFKSLPPIASLSQVSISGETVDDEEDPHVIAWNQLAREEFDLALQTSQSMVENDPRDALAHFLAGRAAFSLGRFEDANDSFQQAINQDVCPLRATTRVTETVRRLARELDVPLVDFDQLLQRDCQQKHGHACLGKEYFLDHVHPTIDAHRQLATWMVDQLQSERWIASGSISPEQMARIHQEVNLRIDSRATGIAFRNLAKVLHWSGKFAEAEPRARDAIERLPEDLESRFVLADCLTQLGRLQKAYEQYSELFAIGVYPKATIPFGELLYKRGELNAAKSYLLQGIVTDNDEHRARAHYWLGRVHLDLEEYTMAVESLQFTRELAPLDISTRLILAEAMLGLQDEESAMNELRHILKLDDSHFQARYRLAMIHLAAGRTGQAREQLHAAQKLRPEDANVQAALRMIESM